MPSRSKRIFSLSRLRSRSRSVANSRGRRLEDDDGGDEERRRPSSRPKSKATTRPSPPSSVASSSAVSNKSKSSKTKRTKSPVATSATTSTRDRRVVVSPPAKNEHRSKPRPRPETIAAPQAASYNNNTGTSSSPTRRRKNSSSQQQRASPLRAYNDISRDSTTTTASECNSDFNNQFITAFNRSPPSFDQFDSDLLLSDTGVFPQQANSGSFSVVSLDHTHNTSTSSHNHSYVYSSVGPSHSVEDQDSFQQPQSVGLNGSYPSDYEPQSVGPNGILWGDSSVSNNDGEECESANNNNIMVHHGQDCFSGSADPPAILMGLDDDDLIDDEEVDEGLGMIDSPDSPEDGEKHEPSDRNKDQDSQWFDSFTDSEWKEDEPKNKNRRLVSPSPAKASEPLKTVGKDDFASWGGGTATKQNEPGNNFQTSDDVFGSNFFKSGNRFDSNDGFGSVEEDAFFGNSWMEVNAHAVSNASKQKKGSTKKESDPWGEASFVDTSFNYSRSHEDADQGSPLFEEKKDDDVIGQNNMSVASSVSSADQTPPNAGDPPAAHAQASKVWDSQADGARAALVTPSQTSQDAASNQSKQPLSAQAPASRVWDGQADGAPAALVAPSQASQGAASSQSKQHHPLLKAASSPQKQEKHEVVVTFDKSLTSNNNGRSRPPSIISERKVSHGSSAVVSSVTHHSHRRLNSKESISSQSQLSHSHRRNKKGGCGSVSSSHSQQRRTRKGGGSVGSNSSAVDQILEHYRQKRRLAKDKVGARVKPSGSSSVHSGVQAGSVSVHSGSQFSTPGSSSGVSTSAGNGVAGSGHGGHARHHRRIPSGGSTSHRRVPSGGSSNHRRIPSGGSSSHRRIPSSESVSRIIENLESAAAATPLATGRAKSTISHRAPSPAVGNYYPPSTRGFRGVGGGMGSSGGDDAADHHFLMANIEATIGPRGVAPDMESLSGRSVRSHRSQSQPRPRSSNNNRHRSSSSRPHRSPTRSNNRRVISGDASVDSRTSKASRNSFRTYQSTRSALTTMSKETQSVANDLFRLEAQLAEVARQQEEEEHLRGGGNRAATKPPTSKELSANDINTSNTLGAEPVPRPTPFQITAPPGKLGILLSNKSGQKGPTHVSAVRSESVLAGKVHVGDIFMSIDGEDVTRMNSKEITNIMARKAEFERMLRFRPLVSSTPQRQEWI